MAFAEKRTSLAFGRQKIHSNAVGKETNRRPAPPEPGSADRCIVTSAPTAEIVARAHALGIAVAAGPGRRDGALGPTRSVHSRDPDGYHVALANREERREEPTAL